MKIAEKIKCYGEDVKDLETSPFEAVNMLHARSFLETKIGEMTEEEKIELNLFDRELIENADVMAKHIEKIYDFKNSTEPEEQWWWHLRAVADGRLKK